MSILWSTRRPIAWRPPTYPSFDIRFQALMPRVQIYRIASSRVRTHRSGHLIAMRTLFSELSPMRLKDTVDRSHWEIMYRTILAVSRTMDIDQLLQQILELIFQWVGCDRGCIMLTCEETHELRPVARRNRATDKPSERIEISKTILDYVVGKREGVLTSNASADRRWDPGASITGMGFVRRSAFPCKAAMEWSARSISIPRSRPTLCCLAGQSIFNEEHLKLMIAIGHQAALPSKIPSTIVEWCKPSDSRPWVKRSPPYHTISRTSCRESAAELFDRGRAATPGDTNHLQGVDDRRKKPRANR